MPAWFGADQMARVESDDSVCEIRGHKMFPPGEVIVSTESNVLSFRPPVPSDLKRLRTKQAPPITVRNIQRQAAVGMLSRKRIHPRARRLCGHQGRWVVGDGVELEFH